ncbi:ABC transporter ATP-binding protein [candidate division KSB1 bacterium]|nr:ABC transporter ATP-binding protein [candidate division KSB1 bacterium]
MAPVLQIKNLSRVYRKNTVEVSALQDITFDVTEGSFISIVGRSGSGKSTLLNLIGGLDTASSGEIWCGGRNLSALSRNELAEHRRHRVGMVFQSFNLISSRTAQENVELALAFGNVQKKERKIRATDILTQLGLGERLDHTPGELSGGESQRVAIARALANKPDILLADEPTGNLDSRTSEEILELIKQLNVGGITILMVTHDAVSAESISDRMIRLLDGYVEEDKILRGVR